MSKLAKEILEAVITYEGNPPLTNSEIIDDVLKGRTIKKSELEQLRKDAAYAGKLNEILGVMHVNLARAENELATEALLRDLYHNEARCNAEAARQNEEKAEFWLNEANEYAVTMNVLANKWHWTREKLWDVEKELNDLKKEIEKEPEFIEPIPHLNPLQALGSVNLTVRTNPEDATWTWTGPSSVGQRVGLSEPEPSKGLKWIGLGLLAGALLAFAALVHHIANYLP